MRVHLPLVVSIIDNGDGIPEDLQAHLFDPFVTTKRNGTGLGLALVAKIIGDHGGVIEFDSQPRRTVFRVSLPMMPRDASCGRRCARGRGMSGATILIADDDRAIRTVLSQALGRLGYDVRTTGNAATLWRWVADGDGDLVITDVVMPDENGLDLIPRIKKLRAELRIIVMSAQNTLLTAVKATERGAFEYLPKPFDLRELVNVVQRALTAPNTAAPIANGDETEEQLPLIGRSPAMQEIYRVLARLMGTDLTVMISGESGTGKELVAKALHDYGKRRNGPFVAVNMAAIPRELIESDLFGHEKGSFTGAHSRGIGPLRAGAGRQPVPRRNRRHAARSADSAAARAAVGRIHHGRRPRADSRRHPHHRRDPSRPAPTNPPRSVPRGLVLPPQCRADPLAAFCAERTEDVSALVRHFFTLAHSGRACPLKSLDVEAMERLKSYRWPGNVRELENLIRRLAALYSQEVIGRDAIEAELAETAPNGNWRGGAQRRSRHRRRAASARLFRRA